MTLPLLALALVLAVAYGIGKVPDL